MIEYFPEQLGGPLYDNGEVVFTANQKVNGYWKIENNINKKQKEQKDTEDEDRARNWNRTNY